MNKQFYKRIEELAKKCSFGNDKYGLYWDENANAGVVDLEKFAELIVRECAQFVEDEFDFIGDEIIVKEKMLEHFGVEQ